MEILMAISIILVVATISLGVYGIRNRLNSKRTKRFLGISLPGFFIMIIAATVVLFSGSTVSAAETAEVVASNIDGLRFIAAALSTGLACIGSGIAVAISGSAAIGAISENEKLLGKALIFVGLAEGIAIYGLIISIMILNA